MNSLSGLGFDAADDAVDERARGEVLASAGLGLAGVLLQQPLVEVSEAVLLGTEPVDGIEALDQLLQVARLTQAGLGISIDGGDELVVVHDLAVGIFTTGELQQDQLVFVEQVEARFAGEVGPAAPLGQLVLL